MNIISRYILRAHIGPFFFGTVLVMFLFLFQFLLKKLDDLVGKGLSEWVIIQLISLNLSWMVVLAVPMGVLFSTVMAFGSMSSVHEITIVKSSGGSLLRMMRPIVVGGFLLSLALFWFNDQVLPEANHQAKVLWMDIQRKKPTFTMEPGQFSQQLDGYTILSRQVDSLTGTLKGVTIYDNRSSNQANIVSADTGLVSFTPDMSKLILDLYHGEIHQMSPYQSDKYRKVDFKEYRIYIAAKGFNLTRTDDDLISRGDREMKIEDMQVVVNQADSNEIVYKDKLTVELDKHYAYLTGGASDTTVDKLQSSFSDDTSFKGALRGVQRRTSFLKSSISSDLMRQEDYSRKSREYRVEIHKKYAIPFACFVFVLVGVPLGIMTKGGNFGISAAISIGFYIFYWACLIGGEKLGNRGFIDPAFSMWMGNIAIAIMGIILIIKVNNESFNIPGAKLFEIIKAKFTKD